MDRLITRLTDLSNDPAAVAALDRAGQLLVAADIADRTADLARRAYHDTLAAAILAAALRACPDARDDDLIVDVIPGTSAASPATVWLSETTIGGLGVIEYLIRYYAEDPRRFWTLVADAQQPNDYEHTDVALTRLLRHVAQEAPHGSAAAALADLRKARSAADAAQALRRLRSAWADLDGPPRHSALAALATRIMRPGSSTETDAMSLSLIDEWAALEHHLGFEVDARVIAYAVGSGQLKLGSGRQLTADQAFSMLWPRGAQARSHHLQHYQPYADVTRPAILDRLLLEAAHDEHLPRIEVTAAGWEERYQKAMAEHGASRPDLPRRRPAQPQQRTGARASTPRGPRGAARLRRCQPDHPLWRRVQGPGRTARGTAVSELSRTVRTGARMGLRADAILTTALLSELIFPGDALWVVSSWITDVAVLDNSQGAFDSVLGDNPPTAGRLSQVLALIAAAGARLHVVTRPGTHNEIFIRRLRAAVTDSRHLRVVLDPASS